MKRTECKGKCRFHVSESYSGGVGCERKKIFWCELSHQLGESVECLDFRKKTKYTEAKRNKELARHFLGV